ncbi:MAG: ATP-binding protein [Desulfurococcales archaeon]|nr:ATP-binding protein [Desulfurococcales archaeon]
MKRLGEYLEEMLSRAYEEASRYGRVIGRVSRYSEVRTGPGRSVIVEVDPGTYYTINGPHRGVGDYLVIVDPKTLHGVLVRVSSVTRIDEVAGLGVDPPLSLYDPRPDPQALLTLTFLEVEPILEAPLEGGDPVPATTSLEPQSPVIDPEPGLLERLLSLPGDGVLLGSLASPGGLVKGGLIRVSIPIKALLQHTLIIGTTGSGKTTLMKNMAASMYSLGKPPILVVLDLNQDFIQLPIPPLSSPGDDPVYRSVYRGVKPPERVIVLAPVTLDMVRSVYGEPSRLEDLALGLAMEHYRESIKPLTGDDPEWSVVSVAGVPVAHGGRIAFIPYAINTMEMHTDSLYTLLPGLTSLSRETLRRIRERFRRERGVYPPLQVLYAALLQYSSRRGEAWEAEEEAIEVVAPYILSPTDAEATVTTFKVEGLGSPLIDAVQEVLEILRRVRPHMGSIEALYRRIGAILDSGIADILVATSTGGIGNTLKPVPEPPWEVVGDVASRVGGPIVADLGWAAYRGLGGLEGPRLAAYRMLEGLISWRQRLWASRAREGMQPVIVYIDEAHQFFPQERGAREEQEASRHIASMIARIARLGRARGVGLVFSTHSPKDLHEIILQLANTRIILRTEKGHAERLNLPGDLASLVPRLPDRVMVVYSHAYRESYVMARTSPPVVAHYDISTIV